MKKLDHKLIVFTGPVAAGKSTVMKKLQRLLDDLGVLYREVSTLNDLELPFARQQGYIAEHAILSRQRLTQLMKKLYKRHGRELGSKLLYRFIAKSEPEHIYIIDSKRNPDGIKALNRMFNNVLVVGVTATTLERAKRFNKRKRDIDLGNADPYELFEKEEKLFSVSRSLNLCDLIIENDKLLPNDAEVRMYEALVKKKFIPGRKNNERMVWPRSKTTSARRGAVISKNAVALSLKRFATAHQKDIVFLVQGGNRYIHHFLSASCNLTPHNIKLLCLSKVKISTLLNSVLTPTERAALLSESALREVHQLIRSLPKSEQFQLEKTTQARYGQRLSSVVRTETKAGLVNLFADYKVKTPFTYPADDRSLVRAFAGVAEILDGAEQSLRHKDILFALFKGTVFASSLASGRLVFLDDVLYRGRTLFAISVLMQLFGVDRTRWSFVALCSDIKSRDISHEKIVILNPGYLYPFENSISSEQGYWHMRNFGNYFEFLNLKSYLSLLLSDETRYADKKVLQDWKVAVGRILKKAPSRILITKTKEALISLLVFEKVYRCPLHLDALLDQRCADMGYCAPFAYFIDSFIPQEKSAWERRRYKLAAKKYLDALRQKDKKHNLLETAVSLYAIHAHKIDYHYLKKILYEKRFVSSRM